MASPAALSKALDISELASFSDRDSFLKREEITGLVTRRLVMRSTKEWLAALEQHQVWHALVQDYEDLQSDPQLEHLGAFVTATSAAGAPITLIAHPARYDGKAPTVRLVPQPLGAQTSAIMTELGYSASEIDGFAARGVVRCAENRGPRAE
jgi:crotonobetainyl-CoA:carnitine CoA-transferase CaiB-like acyl-CoA transferase